MVLNTLRLNHQVSSHPNDRITFFKPLARPAADHGAYDVADTFLRAIAAQCLPIMKDHYLSVTTLEEFEPNAEFVGRNFNNGEIIQLVLQSRSGAWLPFRTVQMVMMHELAHNSHMNHGKDFWTTMRRYAAEMTALWHKGYTGEGFWGGGRSLADMTAVMGNNILSDDHLEQVPVCGGTYRSRRRGRARQPKLSWKEQRDRRIERKFGKNGVALGEDEDSRLRLEIHSRGAIGSKPRVAKSKRGRELRAAAALARFETNKQEVAALGGGPSGAAQDKGDADEDESMDSDHDLDDALDVNGQKLLDPQGNAMVKASHDADAGSAPDTQPRETLRDLGHYFRLSPRNLPGPATSIRADSQMSTDAPAAPRTSPVTKGPLPALPTGPAPSPAASATRALSTTPCPICSLENDVIRATCEACAHVLDLNKDPRHWKCASAACQRQAIDYVNSGDAGVCGVCGARKEERSR